MASDQHEHEGEGTQLSEVALRVRTLESLLVDKGLVDPKALDAIVEAYESRIGPHYGAQVVARSWIDADFRRRLFTDANEVVEELGFGSLPSAPTRLVALENTPVVHNMVVCTLCSCYPSQLLGLPPVWYKSAAYRSRAVIEPRAVLREFGLELAAARRGPSVGLDVGHPIPGRTRTARGHRRLERGATGRDRDARCHGGRRQGARAVNGVHDMGGMQCFGAIDYELDEPVFHEHWEGRVLALTRVLPRSPRWNTGEMSRDSMERIPPARYLASSYYERWLIGLERRLEQGGVLTADELADRTARPGGVPIPMMTEDQARAAFRPWRAPAPIDGAAPRFTAGQGVRARNTNPEGHTRLPRYVRGHVGVVDRDLGVERLPDSWVAEEDPRPQHVYSVRFSARELWGPAASAHDAVYVDLWDDYLEAA